VKETPPIAAPSTPQPLRWPVLLAIVAALVIWCAVDVQRRGRVDPERIERHRTDFTVYTVAGAAMFDGRDPYKVTNPRGWFYLYLPMFAIVVSPLAHLDPRWQVTVWFFLSCAFAWGCYRELGKILRSFVGPAVGPPTADGESNDDASARFPSWIAWAALAVALLPAMNNLQRGQVDLLKLFLLLLGFRLSLTGGAWRAWFGGGVALAAAVVLKLTPLLPAGILLLLLAGRVLRGPLSDGKPLKRVTTVSGGMLAGALLLVLVVPASLVGWQDNLRYIKTFAMERVVKMGDGEAADPAGNSRTGRNQCLANATIRLGNFISYQFLGGADDRMIDGDPSKCPPMIMDDPGVRYVLIAARGALVGLLLLAGALSVGRRDTLAQATVFALACAVTLVVSPIGRGSYFTELAPAVLLAPFWIYRAGLPHAAKLVAWTPVALVWLHYCALPIAGRIGLLGLGTTAWTATCLMLIVVGRRAAGEVQDRAARSTVAKRPHASNPWPRRPMTQEYA